MDFGQVLAQVQREVDGASVRGVRLACDDLLSDSRDEVPYDQGDLSRSGQVTVVDSGRTVEGAVSYDTPYAEVQHEAAEFRHDTGKAGYLRDPMRRNADKYIDVLGGEVGKAFR